MTKLTEIEYPSEQNNYTGHCETINVDIDKIVELKIETHEQWAKKNKEDNEIKDSSTQYEETSTTQYDSGR